MLITALNLLFSELHSNVICATKFYSEMLPIKSTCSYLLSECYGINIWADANHWRLPQFKMSCCTWASFKTLVFVGMLTAKFWAYLNPQSEPQFYNRFLKKLSQCCFFESSRRNAWINQCWCTLLTSLLRKKKKKMLSEDNTKASQNFIVESWRSYLSVAFSKVQEETHG